MKKLAALLAGAMGIWLAAQQASTPKPLSELTPAGALLYLEAKNFGALVNDWNGSRAKADWLKSAHYQAFQRSRLILRLDEVYKEYAAATGVPPDLNLLNSIAGGESALAVYDVNKIELLYLTRIASARAMEGLLWRARERFSQRQAGGVTYYVKVDSAANRTACFAVAGDLMLVATKEDALAGALVLLANGNATAVRREPWFQDAVAAGGPQGEVRMVANLARLASTPAFRTYWIQRNGAELRGYRAAVSDLHRSAVEFREERVLLRASATPAPDTSATGALLAMAPPDAALHRVWAQPDAEAAEALVRQKILHPGPAVFFASKSAPEANIEAPIATATDLETRIDQAVPAPDGAVYRAEPVRRLLETNGLRAMLHVQSGRVLADGVFAASDAAIALEGRGDWNAEAVRRALLESVEALYTTQNIGLAWREQNGVWVSDGLARLAMAIRGRTLILGTAADLVRTMRDRNGTPQPPASYAAAVRIKEEIPRYERAMRLIDAAGESAENTEPRFFSGVLTSLPRTLIRADAVTVSETDSGAAVKQTVHYQLAP